MGGLSKLLFLFSVKARRRPVLEPAHHPPPIPEHPIHSVLPGLRERQVQEEGEGQEEDQGGREGVPS